MKALDSKGKRVCQGCSRANEMVYIQAIQQYYCASCDTFAPDPTTPKVARVITYQVDSPLQIFLSYGHDRYQAITMSLNQELKRRGHTVWCDVEDLAAGCDWERGIDDGIASCKEAQEHGRIVLLMTPHALRRPNGYCLNEISRALSLKMSIFPILLHDCEPPSSLFSTPFYDMRDCVPQVSAAEEAEWTEEERKGKWDRAFDDILSSEMYRSTLNKFISILELCTSMNDYAVLHIAGPERLGIVSSARNASQESKILRNTRSSKRLLVHRSSSNLNRGVSLGSSASTVAEEGVSAESVEVEVSETNEASDEIATGRLVFTYDAPCFELASKIRTSLCEKGFEIFPLEKSLTESRMQNAIQWASELPDSKLVLFVSPGSVGRPNGVSLNHITAAMSAGMGFVPVMVRYCEIPLSICRIQWLDMTDCLMPDENAIGQWKLNDLKCELRLKTLIDALSSGLDHDGQQQRLFSLFAPLSFRSKIAEHTRSFAGRKWLLDKYESWIENLNASNLFWISGQVGTGKTAIAAKLIQTRPEVVAFHFASAEDDQTKSTRRCLLSLTYQLTTQLPEYAAALQSGDPLEEIVPVSTPSELMEKVVLLPLQGISPPERRMVILVDGLEMIGTEFKNSRQDDSLAGLLPTLIGKLPSWMRILCFSRDDPRVKRSLQSFTPTVCLDQSNESTMQDIQTYLQKTLLPYYCQEIGRDKVEALKIDCVPQRVIEQITARAENLFLYAGHIVNAIAEGRLHFSGISDFPVGMGGFLKQFFEYQFTISYFESGVRPILEVLCAAYEPLQMEILGSIMNWDIYEQRKVAEALGSLFQIESDNIVRPFHSSVFEWLQNPSAAGDFFVEAGEGHSRIGKWAWKEYEKALADNNDFSKLDYELEQSPNATKTNNPAHIYIVRYVCDHLMQAYDEECITLLGNFSGDEKFQLARRLLGLREQGLGSFFHGDIGRVESQDLLSKQPEVGSFLIRYSARQKSYCASFIDKIVDGAPCFKHNLIFHLKSGAYSAVPSKSVIAGVTATYPDLTSFVEAYQRKGILKHAIPCLSEVTRSISIAGRA